MDKGPSETQPQKDDNFLEGHLCQQAYSILLHFQQQKFQNYDLEIDFDVNYFYWTIPSKRTSNSGVKIVFDWSL